MKYLLKIPLLAISMACNRSAQEIKMIVPQSPIPLSPSSQTTPCATSLRANPPPPSTHPSPAAITANICSLFPWHLLSMTTLALGGGGVRMCVMRGGGCGLGHPSLNYRHSALSWGEYSTRKLHCQGCTLQEWLLISSGGLWSQTAGASKWAGVSSSFQISAKLSKAGIKWEKTSLMDACLVSWSPFTSTA